MNMRFVSFLMLIAFAASPWGALNSRGSSTATEDVILVASPNDVMGGAAANVPGFPKLTPKSGYLRGWVRDGKGQPLAGASIMVYPPALLHTGRYSRAAVSAKSDANGLYEVKIPSGDCVIWCAGYAAEYHGVRLAMTLRPASGELGPLNQKEGEITNFVLSPYGIIDPEKVSKDPQYAGGYYGASFTIGYSTREAGNTTSPSGWLPLGSEVEITLTPDGPLVDGSMGRSLLIRQALSPRGYTQINDIPIGRYQIRATLVEHNKRTPLRIRDNSDSGRKGGMIPVKTDSVGTVLFRSAGSDPTTLRVSTGNMERLRLTVERAK